MKWEDKYAIGIQRVDKQHRMIFRVTDDFRDALDEGSGERTYAIFLNFLDDYCEKHFKTEEQYMEENHCPVAQKNKEEHSIFHATIHDYQQRLKDSGYMDSSARALLNLIDQWIKSHICKIDKQLKGYVKK
jgi:hemerythrin